MRYALVHALDHEWRNLVVEGDSKLIIDCVRGHLADLLRWCFHLISNMVSWRQIFTADARSVFPYRLYLFFILTSLDLLTLGVLSCNFLFSIKKNKDDIVMRVVLFF